MYMRIISILLLIVSFSTATAERTFKTRGGGERDYTLPTFEREAANPRTAFRYVTGAATKGPIANASISVYELDDTGSTVGSAVATATSDNGGGFTVSLPASASGMLLVMTSGGSFIDESDTRPLAERRRISLGNGEGFRSIILNGQSTVAVTPYTDALVERALAGGRLGGFKDIMAELMTLSANGFGFSPFETLPANPNTPSGSTAELQYAMLLGAFANIANVIALKMGMPAPDYELIRALIEDLTDGDNDGALFGKPITVGGTALPVIDFDQQLIRFRNNNYAGFGMTPLPAWDSAADELALQYPAEFYGALIYDIPRVWGIRAFPVGHTELFADGTGDFIDASGLGHFLWASAGNVLVRDFSSFGGKLQQEFTFSDFDPVTGETIFINEKHYFEKIELTITQDDGNRIQANAVSTVRIERTNESTGEVEVLTEVRDPEPVSIFAKATRPPIPDPVQFEEPPALPALTNGNLPFPGQLLHSVDGMKFNADGTGFTTIENEPFNWSLVDNGTGLRTAFANGETSTHYILTLLDDYPDIGDLVVTELTVDGQPFTTGSTILSNFESLTWNQSNASAILEFEFFFYPSWDEGTRIPYTVQDHLYPDGTGTWVSVGFFGDANGGITNIPIYFRNGICWELDAEGHLLFRVIFIDSETDTTPEICANLSQADTSRLLTSELYDEFNGEFHTVVTTSQLNGTAYEPVTIQPEIGHISEFFSGHPPFPLGDGASGTPSSPITLNVLANDQPGDFPIDPTTVEIYGQPLNVFTGQAAAGNFSIDPATGDITYTPDAGDSTSRLIYLNYRVRDTAGNLSSPAFASFNVDPASAPPPDPGPLPSAMSGTYSGTYAWDCGSPGFTGSTTMQLDLLNEQGSSVVSGTVTMLGGQAPVSGQRLDLPTMGPFGFEGGTPDPAGMYLALNYPEVLGAFVYNNLSLQITGSGLAGTAINGESGEFGCSHPDFSAGTIDLIKIADAPAKTKARPKLYRPEDPRIVRPDLEK